MDEVAVGAKPKAAPKKKMIMIGGGLAAVLVLGIGGFIAFKKFTAEPPPPPRPLVAVKPKEPAVVTPVVAQPVTPVNETVEETKPAEAVGPATETAGNETETAAEVQPAVPPPPPAASVAFRGWVENLKISGLRGGANPRIFIGGSSYQRGDLVNPQLGIIFKDYNDATRTLTFEDGTRATVERRN